VLFTDIVDATSKLSEVGDNAWQALLRQHHDVSRAELSL
jgi:class 3 adenylate cyclase